VSGRVRSQLGLAPPPATCLRFSNRRPRPHYLLPCRLPFRQLQVQIQELAEDVFAGLPAVGLEHQGIEALILEVALDVVEYWA